MQTGHDRIVVPMVILDASIYSIVALHALFMKNNCCESNVFFNVDLGFNAYDA